MGPLGLVFKLLMTTPALALEVGAMLVTCLEPCFTSSFLAGYDGPVLLTVVVTGALLAKPVFTVDYVPLVRDPIYEEGI